LPRSISDAIFVHKFNKFIEAGKINSKDLSKLNKRLSGRKKARFWKLIFTSLQSHDDEKRSELVGKIIKAFADNLLSYEEVILMIHVSNRINIENLRYLLQCYLSSPRTMPGYVRQEYVMLGLLGIDESRVGTWGGGSTQYPLTNFGAKFTGVIFDYPTYTNRSDLRLGIVPLVGCQRNITENTREVLPIVEVINKNYWYSEAAVVVRDLDEILIDLENPVLKSTPILAGEYGEMGLSKLTSIEEEKFTPVFIWRDELRHITIHFYLLEKVQARKLITNTSFSWVNLGHLIRTSTNDKLKGLSEAIIKHEAVKSEQKSVT
jgi:hypothetical protein